MIRYLVIGVITCACGVPAGAWAQDQERVADLPMLNLRMTAVAGALWQTPVQRMPPTRGSLLPPLYVSLIGLEAYDGYSTTRALKHGATESNALLSPVVGNSPALWAVKGAATFASIYAAERLWRRGHRGQAIVVMVVSNGVMAAVAASNASVLRAQH